MLFPHRLLVRRFAMVSETYYRGVRLAFMNAPEYERVCRIMCMRFEGGAQHGSETQHLALALALHSQFTKSVNQ